MLKKTMALLMACAVLGGAAMAEGTSGTKIMSTTPGRTEQEQTAAAEPEQTAAVEPEQTAAVETEQDHVPAEPEKDVPVVVGQSAAAKLDSNVTALPINFAPGKPLDQANFIGEYEYADPTITVSIENNREFGCLYWVATIRIADPSQLRSVSADGFDSEMTMPGPVLAKRVNAVLAVDGDYYCYSSGRYTYREGILYESNFYGARDVLVIDEDGDFHGLLSVDQKTLDAMNGMIDGKKIINVLFFGPVLYADGMIRTGGNEAAIGPTNHSQRMALCQSGPLEYKVICCEAPKRGSTGMTMDQFRAVVAAQNVQIAYNLDGGDSTMLIFNGVKLNDPENPNTRDIADIVYFASAYDAEGAK